MIHLRTIAPPLMGALMGLIMLRMAHGIMTQESDLSGLMLLVFVLGHFVVIGVVAGLIIWSARFAPALHTRLKRLHRPSVRHMSQMVVFATGAAFVAHLILHGGL